MNKIKSLILGALATVGGVRLGMGDAEMDANLLRIEKGVVNLKLDGATAFQVNGDKTFYQLKASAKP